MRRARLFSYPLFGHSSRLVLWLVVLAPIMAAVPAGAVASEERPTVGEVSAEVMCPVCGTLLELAEAPQAQRQKAFIARLIAAGKTKSEIKDALVAEYGEEVLALPRGSGFDLSAYLVPILAFAVALVALVLGVLKWRRAGGGPDEPPPGPSREDAERLDADLARYDL
jgi:cytochrome c-type biogenesis protein CcmH